MAQKVTVKTTFEPRQIIQPFYTGGSVSLSRDGHTLATCVGEDVIITDLGSTSQLVRIEGDGEPVTTLSLTPSASHLVICSRSMSMRIFALESIPASPSSLEAQLQRTVRAHSSPVVTSAVDRTGTLLATGGADGIVKVWDIKGGYVTHTFHGHGGVISALHFFEVDATSARSETSQGVKRKRSRSSMQANGESEAQDATVGFRLASGGEDGKVRVWDLHKRKSVAILDSHVSVVRSIDYSPPENALVSGSRDKTAIIWDARTWKVRRTIAVLEAVESTGFLQEGSIIFTGGENGRIRLWSVASSKEITEEQEAGNETDALLDVLHHDGLDYILSVHADQCLVLHSLEPLLSWVRDEVISPLPVSDRISGTYDEVIDLAYLGNDKEYLALATNTEDLKIISLLPPDSTANPKGRHFGADVARLQGHEDIIICLDVDWSGHWVATGAKDNTARLWRVDPDSDSYECYSTFTGHAESLGAIALPHSIPPVGSQAQKNPLNNPPQFLITGSQDKTVKRWDITSGSKGTTKSARASYTRKAHDKDINALDANHDSTLFASASQDKTVKIWSVQNGEVRGVLSGHKRGVWAVRFAPKETPSNISNTVSSSKGLILTGSGDKTVKVWSLTDFSCLLTLEGHTNSVLKVLWLPSTDTENHSRDKRGAQVASAAGDGLVKVWDLGSGELACTLDNHTDRVWAMAAQPTSSLSEDSMTLVSGGGDGVITFWVDTTSATVEAAATQETMRIEQDQELQNFLHAGNYREAITLALQLNQPARLLALFKAVAEAEEQDPTSLSGNKAVDDVLATLADEQLFILLLRLRDWNTNARTATVAQRILWTLVKSYPASRLVNLKPPRGRTEAKGSLREILDALRAYTDRHLRRVEELVDESYLLDFTLREMGEVAGTEVKSNGFGGGENDVLMLEG